MSKIRSANEVFQKEGVIALFTAVLSFIYRNTILYIYRDKILIIYEKIRPYMPKNERVFIYNEEVKVPVEVTLTDKIVPYYNNKAAGDSPRYEGDEIKKLKKKVSNSDDLVIIGGGWGVSAVVAGKIVGSQGSVTVYEPNKQCFQKIQNVLSTNDVANIVEVNHAIVGEIVSLNWSRSGDEVVGDAETIPINNLPPADVYEVDCEGAEVPILDDLVVRPEWIIVETHEIYGAPKEQTIQLLRRNGYSIEEIVTDGVTGDGVSTVTAHL
jgi:hypothetical protein